MPDFTPILCGTTFFDLLIANKKRGIVEPQLMQNFIQIFDPSSYYPGDTAKQNTAQYKKGLINGSGWIVFDKKEYIDAVNSAFKDEYYKFLDKISFFLKNNIKDEKHLNMLGKQIIELIIIDNTITDDDEFYLESNQYSIKKKDILINKRYQIQPIFFGVWKYIINKKISNQKAIETYEQWFSSKGPNQKVEFISNIGTNQCKDIIVQNIEFMKQEIEIPIISDKDEDFDFNSYLLKAKTYYSKVKTLLYEYQPHNFDTLFECSDIIEPLETYENTKEKTRIENATHKKLYNEIGNNKLLLTGTGGIGKSMMMKNLLLRAIEDYQNNNTNIIPIYITLKDFNLEDKNLNDLILKFYKQFDDIDNVTFEKKLRNGKFLLLFDGLDEIKTAYLNNFYTQLDIFIKKYSSNFIIISSRPFDSFVHLSTFSQLLISPLSKQQAINLIKKLDFRPDNIEIKSNFIKDLDAKIYNTHTEFASNPLLLTIMLMTYEEIAEIPEKVHIFYDEAFSALAKRHDATKGAYKRVFKTGLTVEELKIYISELCARSYKDELFELTEDEIAKYINSAKSSFKKNNISIKIDFSIENFIEDLRINLCLIYYENNKYHFIHRSIQEFFTALYFSNKPDNSMKNLINFFESNNSRKKTDMVFGMLTNMVPQKVEEYIYLPYLEQIIPDTIDHKNILDTINKIYSTLYYTTCDYNDENINRSYSFFYEHITRKVLKIPYPVLTNMKYYQNTFLKNIKINGKIIGSSHKIFLSNLISSSIKYKELLDQLMTSDIFKELNLLLKYKLELKERIERKADDIFD